MRIAHIITSLSIAGAQMMLFKLLSGMDRQTYVPIVICLTDHGPLGEHIQSLGVPVHAVSMRPGLPKPVPMWRLLRILKSLGPDLIQGWQYHGNLAAIFGAKFLSKRPPVIWNIRHSIHDLTCEKKATVAAIKLGAKCSDRPIRIIYVANASAAQHEALGYASAKRVIIPNGFDTQHFAPSELARSQIRAELGLSPSAMLIGLIARYHPIKNHTNFLRAAAHLSQIHSNIHFLLVGEDIHTDNRTLMNLIRELGVGGQTHLLGERRDISRVIAALDIASSASSGEGFSNVIGEAMACGVPCVVTDVGDSAFIVGDAGKIVPPASPIALAKAWQELVEVGQAVRIKLGLAARKRIEEHYSLPAIVARYEKLYSDIGEGFLAGIN